MTNVGDVDASTLYPAWWPADRLVHFGRLEARRKSAAVLLAVCASVTGERRTLQRVPARRWWQLRRRRWCPACATYREQLDREPRR